MKKIFLGGCPFGDENLGDDAILSSLLNTFGSRKMFLIDEKFFKQSIQTYSQLQFLSLN